MHCARLSVLLLALPFAATPILARAADPVSTADRAFIAKVSQGGMFEVRLGKLAQDQGSTQDIRDQGQTEEHDHKLVGEKLKSIAGDADVDIPADLVASFQSEYDALKAKSGAAFDDTYIADMKTIHLKDGAAFAEEAKSGQNPKLRAFAAETYKIVQRHLGELKAPVGD